MTEQLRFGKFRQRMCDLLWETGCDHLALSDERNAKRRFNTAHYICNDLLNEFEIIER